MLLKKTKTKKQHTLQKVAENFMGMTSSPQLDMLSRGRAEAAMEYENEAVGCPMGS